jgi:hypothetical protein
MGDISAFSYEAMVATYAVAVVGGLGLFVSALLAGQGEVPEEVRHIVDDRRR